MMETQLFLLNMTLVLAMLISTTSVGLFFITGKFKDKKEARELKLKILQVEKEIATAEAEKNKSEKEILELQLEYQKFSNINTEQKANHLNDAVNVALREIEKNGMQ